MADNSDRLNITLDDGTSSVADSSTASSNHKIVEHIFEREKERCSQHTLTDLGTNTCFLLSVSIIKSNGTTIIPLYKP